MGDGGSKCEHIFLIYCESLGNLEEEEEALAALFSCLASFLLSALSFFHFFLEPLPQVITYGRKITIHSTPYQIAPLQCHLLMFYNMQSANS